MKFTKHYRIEIGTGTSLDATGALIPASTRQKAIREIARLACELFGGATLTPATGIWRDPVTGRIHDESSLTVVALVPATNDKARKKAIRDGVTMLADTVKGTLGQAAVLVNVSIVKAAFH